MEKLIHSSTDCIDRKQNHGANLLFHKIPVSLHLGITPNTEFQRHLTPYACSYVQKQFELSKHVVIPENSANTVSVQRQGGETQSPYSDREGKHSHCTATGRGNTVSVQRQGGETQTPYSDREGKHSQRTATGRGNTVTVQRQGGEMQATLTTCTYGF